jgi:hypothetical protein
MELIFWTSHEKCGTDSMHLKMTAEFYKIIHTHTQNVVDYDPLVENGKVSRLQYVRLSDQS